MGHIKSQGSDRSRLDRLKIFFGRIFAIKNMKNNRRGGRSFGNGPWKNRKNNHKNMEEKDNITPQEEATAEVKSEETQQENPLAEGHKWKTTLS